MPGNGQMDSNGSGNAQKADELNESFIQCDSNSDADTDISGFRSTESSIPSSLCSSELNKTLNEILGLFESELILMEHKYDQLMVNEYNKNDFFDS